MSFWHKGCPIGLHFSVFIYWLRSPSGTKPSKKFLIHHHPAASLQVAATAPFIVFSDYLTCGFRATYHTHLITIFIVHTLISYYVYIYVYNYNKAISGKPPMCPSVYSICIKVVNSPKCCNTVLLLLVRYSPLRGVHTAHSMRIQSGLMRIDLSSH